MENGSSHLTKKMDVSELENVISGLKVSGALPFFFSKFDFCYTNPTKSKTKNLNSPQEQMWKLLKGEMKLG